jgi:1-acyl-sn-glycerol-3-phosphate acyltransferase
MALKVPPKPVRALVITPIVFVGSLLVTVLSPALHLVLAVIDLIDGKRWRFTRIVGLGIAFCVVELFGLVMAFALWVTSGFGLLIHTPFFQLLHRLVFETWLEMITRAIKTFIGFRFVFPPDKLGAGPLLVLARHAGPGDALLIARALAHDHGRRLRMLGTTKLLWDPFFNHLVNRLPFYFCEEDPKDAEAELEAIRRAAGTIEENGAMIVFPEGGNYTPTRKRIAVQRLRSRGLPDWADRAERLRHVLPPRTGSTLAALRAAADAQVLVVAHVGLDDLLTLRDIWDSVPIDRTVRATLWAGFDGERPSSRAEMVEWLYSQWESVDEWIEQNSTHVFGARSSALDH